MEIQRIYQGTSEEVQLPDNPYAPPGDIITNPEIAWIGDSPLTSNADYWRDILTFVDAILGTGAITVIDAATQTGILATTLADYDLVIMQSDDMVESNIAPQLLSIDIPVIILGNSANTGEGLGLSEGAGSSGTASRNNIRIIEPVHPVIAGLFVDNEDVIVKTSSGVMREMAASTIPAGGQVLAVEPGTTDAVLVLYEKGSTLWDVATGDPDILPAVARRAFIGFGYGSGGNVVSPLGITLFLRVCHWALNYY